MNKTLGEVREMFKKWAKTKLGMFVIAVVVFVVLSLIFNVATAQDRINLIEKGASYSQLDTTKSTCYYMPRHALYKSVCVDHDSLGVVNVEYVDDKNEKHSNKIVQYVVSAYGETQKIMKNHAYVSFNCEQGITIINLDAVGYRGYAPPGNVLEQASAEICSMKDVPVLTQEESNKRFEDWVNKLRDMNPSKPKMERA